MSKEEFLNYIIDFAMDAEWGDLKRREQLRALFTSWCFIFGIDADTKECDDVLGAICFRAAFERAGCHKHTDQFPREGTWLL